ncbi:MAG: nucleotidyl transferase AbiEii/AbiGii toxin family protein [Candidatus Methanoperedens sp.]|nr:nucleotidyl transferase AbiEii/AbiGii toxin family protein [Candidatus Methanoperedens sp.]
MDENELRRRARKTGFDVVTLEKDYALTWLLSGIYWEDSKLRDLLIFKGGTAIRKIYFPEWRLSEDLDFTIIQEVDPQNLRQGFEEFFLSINKKSNIAYSFSALFCSAPVT